MSKDSSSSQSSGSNWSSDFPKTGKDPLDSQTIESWTYEPSKEDSASRESSAKSYETSLDNADLTPKKKEYEDSDFSPVEDTYEDQSESPKKIIGLKSPKIYPWPDDTEEEEKSSEIEGKASVKQGKKETQKMDFAYQHYQPSFVLFNIGGVFIKNLTQKKIRVMNSVYKKVEEFKIK